MSESEPALPESTRFHSPGAQLGAIIGCSFLAWGVYGYIRSTPGTADQVVLITLFVVLIVLAIRGLIVGIVLTKSGVEVRGFLRTRKVPWSEVADFGFTPSNPMNRTVYIAVQLTNGRFLKTGGLSGRSPEHPTALGILNDMRAVRRSLLEGPSSPPQ